MKLLLNKQQFDLTWPYRKIEKNDKHSLGKLMFESYQGTIDSEGETLEETFKEVQVTFDGKYGHFLEDCSFAYEHDGRLLSASVVTWFEKNDLPLLTCLMTHPKFKKQGIANFLLKQSVNALQNLGYEYLHLYVTSGNVPALRLYEKMGFAKF